MVLQRGSTNTIPRSRGGLAPGTLDVTKNPALIRRGERRMHKSSYMMKRMYITSTMQKMIEYTITMLSLIPFRPFFRALIRYDPCSVATREDCPAVPIDLHDRGAATNIRYPNMIARTTYTHVRSRSTGEATGSIAGRTSASAPTDAWAAFPTT